MKMPVERKSHRHSRPILPSLVLFMVDAAGAAQQGQTRRAWRKDFGFRAKIHQGGHCAAIL